MNRPEPTVRSADSREVPKAARLARLAARAVGALHVEYRAVGRANDFRSPSGRVLQSGNFRLDAIACDLWMREPVDGRTPDCHFATVEDALRGEGWRRDATVEALAREAVAFWRDAEVGKCVQAEVKENA